MLGVDGIKEIRRAHCREGRSIRGISRDLGVSRVTIRKVLRSGAMEFVYKRRTLMRTFEELRSLGYESGTDAVRRHAAPLGEGAGCGIACDGACSFELRSPRCVPVRLEPRGCRSWRQWGPGGGCAYASLPQPDVLRAPHGRRPLAPRPDAYRLHERQISARHAGQRGRQILRAKAPPSNIL